MLAIVTSAIAMEMKRFVLSSMIIASEVYRAGRYRATPLCILSYGQK